MWVILTVPVQTYCLIYTHIDLLLDIHPHCGLEVTNCMDLHFVPAEKMDNDMNNMKFGLDVSTKVKFEWPGPKTRVIIGFFGKFCSASLQALTYACVKMKSLAHETEYNKNTLFHFFHSFSRRQPLGSVLQNTGSATVLKPIKKYLQRSSIFH